MRLQRLKTTQPPIPHLSHTIELLQIGTCCVLLNVTSRLVTSDTTFEACHGLITCISGQFACEWTNRELSVLPIYLAVFLQNILKDPKHSGNNKTTCSLCCSCFDFCHADRRLKRCGWKFSFSGVSEQLCVFPALYIPPRYCVILINSPRREKDNLKPQNG